jgi:hypothetical protein
MRRLIPGRDHLDRDPNERSRHDRFEQTFHRSLINRQRASRRDRARGGPGPALSPAFLNPQQKILNFFANLVSNFS